MIDWDVVVIGAGISGIGASYHLSRKCPDTSFVVLEGRDQLGGTWDLFRYPGVRSDSDMHTLGYGFKPWVHEQSIADGDAILEYLHQTVEEFDLEKYIRYNHHVSRASWSADDSAWTLTVDANGESTQVRCRMLYVCTGYYRYREGYTPDFPGRDAFAGLIVHPQQWPEELDVSDQRVVVIGSGATAVTLVPALATDAAHVTMLQRSPTYVVAQPDRDPFAERLRGVLPTSAAYAVTRAKNLTRQQWVYAMTRRSPKRVRAELLGRVRDAIGPELTKAHFTPTYDPWDQRVCLLPNGDLFDAISAGDASVVTDGIDQFTADGIALQSGDHLDADIIVTATGLQLVTLGEIDIVVDGEPVDFANTWTYRGVGYSGVPNLFTTFGYVNASWTVRSDMVNTYVCRVLEHMADIGATTCTPTLRDEDREMVPRPWIDGFSPGYLERSAAELPKQGDREPWLNHQTYLRDRRGLLHSPVDDGVLRFTRRRPDGRIAGE